MEPLDQESLELLTIGKHQDADWIVEIRREKVTVDELHKSISKARNFGNLRGGLRSVKIEIMGPVVIRKLAGEILGKQERRQKEYAYQASLEHRDHSN